MDNWKDLVGFQSGNTPPDVAWILEIEHNPNVQFKIKKHKITIDKTEEEVVAELDKIFSSFTRTVNLKGTDPRAREFHLNRGAVEVVRRSRRGVPTTQWKNAIYYNSPTRKFDTALVVVESEGKFGIFKHPNFDDYGFMIEE